MSRSMAEAALEMYNRQRLEFIQDDRSLRRDLTQHANVTNAEAIAERVFRHLRAAEAVTVWAAEHKDVPHPFPGMEFLTGKRIIEQTKLFELVSKMPKGALLHAHLDATVNAPILLKLALEQPLMHIRVAQRLDAHTIASTLPDMSPVPEAESTSVISLTDESYVPGDWVQMAQARRIFASELGGAAGFDDWIIRSMMIQPSEAYGTHNTPAKIWDKFQSTFFVTRNLLRFTPISAAYIRECFRSAIEDGISYLEVRVNFFAKALFDSNGRMCVSHSEFLHIFERVLEEVKTEIRNEGRQDEFFGARIIYSTLKFVTPEELEWYIEDCIALKKEFPHLIAGFDLVGHEDRSKPLIAYIEPLLRFKSRVEQEGLDIPFILHAGETLGDGTAADDNLYDAMLLGTNRIGHGFSLVKHPRLMEMCREKGILIEVCPISNEILRLTSSMPTHPLPVLINNGIPVALSSDDPSVFGSMGLSYDFYQVLVSSEISGLMTLRQFAVDSIEYCTLNGEDKARVLSAWTVRWNNFVDGIVAAGYITTGEVAT